MQRKEITDVIATRRLTLVDSSEEEVLVLLGKPELSDSFGYYCQFQIKGIGSGEVKYAKGLDSIQAIQGAMFLISADLEFLNQGVANALRWEGDEDGNLGFPKQ